MGNLYLFLFFKLKPDNKVIRNLVFDVADPISKKLTIYSWGDRDVDFEDICKKSY